MKYEEILPLLDSLVAVGAEWLLDVSHKGVGRLWISNVKQSSDNYHQVVSLLTSFYGRLDKEISYGSQSWKAAKDGQTLTMYSVAQCKIVGYRQVEKKKMIEVETEETEIDEEPIYDCTEVQ